MATLKALVCDDEAPLRDLMARRLEKLGLEVERAESGKDAAARIDAQRYDLLITDIYMPDVTGLELLQQMKALDPHAQVVVVTASATLDNAVGALNHGAFAYLTIGVAVLNGSGRVDLINNRAEEALEPVLAAGPAALRDLLDRIPTQDGQKRGEVVVGEPRLQLHLIPLSLAEEGAQQVLVVREPDSAGPSMGTIVQEMLAHVRSGLSWLTQRATDPAAHKILRGMASELFSMATFLGIQLPPEDQPANFDVAAPPGEASSEAPAVETGLAPAVLPPATPPAAEPGNGREAARLPLPPRTGRPATEPLPQQTGSMMLRKGMTMVLEGRLRKKRGYTEPISRPEDRERMQQKIDRWARSGSGEEGRSEEEDKPDKTSKLWPPPLPSSNGES